MEHISDIPKYLLADNKNYEWLKAYKLALKKNETQAEKLLWSYLRCKLMGHKIRRQHIIENYIVDFVCIRKKLVIEIDGGIHLQNKEYDSNRTCRLNDLGFTVIRFKNEEVLLDIETVLSQIKKWLSEN